MPISSVILAGLVKLEDLTEDTWGSWSKTMTMFFCGCGASYITNNAATVPDDKKDIDSELVWTIYSHVHPDYKASVEEEMSGLAAWKILKGRFEKSSMARRLKARSDLRATRKALKGLGCEPSDLETADLLLLNLHSSWSTVRTTITSNKDEQKVSDIISILNGSTVEIDHIKEEYPHLSMAAQHGSFGSGGRYGGVAGSCNGSSGARSTPHGSSSGGHPHGGGSAPPATAPSGPPSDDKGFHWCDPTNENHCHRCGRSGHIAARCIYDMPQHIKDWVMHNSPRKRANTVQRVHFTPSYWNDPNNGDYDSEDEFHGPNDDANIQMPLRI
ncbi:hypothetical protein K438DRAFT_1854860 [Mycena galopus ATCC 62051]|nr:hypothetical protein K438DRAFT_1854860 [Mycena galopus ATCC 62051]